MKLYSAGKRYKLYEGNMIDMLDVLELNSVDSIITDPPYGLTNNSSKGFMGKAWDGSGIEYSVDAWHKCFEVIKPGGFLLAFGGTRTFHRIACAIEEAGFEIRDTIMWLYGTGFPKSMNIGLMIDKVNGVESPVIGQNEAILKKQAKDIREGKRKILDSFNSGAPDRNNGFKTISADIRQAQNEWRGWGTSLKPAYEPIIVARKPCEGSCIDNVLKYGVGGMNIAECRVATDENIETGRNGRSNKSIFQASELSEADRDFQNDGRFPANVILTYDDSNFDEVCGGMPYTKTGDLTPYQEKETDSNIYNFNSKSSFRDVTHTGDSGSAARYFYCAKASNKDRDEGLASFETGQCVGGGGGIGDYLNDVNSCSGKFGSEKAPHKNTHPTVKPTELMQYLIRLVTPKGGVVLDPFNGSGSTGKACMYENRERDSEYQYIGIEITPEYLPIANARIAYVENKPKQYKLF